MNHTILALALTLPLAGCNSGGGGGSGVPGDMSDSAPFAQITAKDVVHVTGTEPFWGAQIADNTLTYTTPEDQAGTAITVESFAGRAGLSFSGDMEGKPVYLMVTQGECSDGMSDRTYPFNATLKLAGDVRSGCAWTDAKPFKGPAAP